MLTNLEVYSSLSSPPDLPLQLGGREDVDPIHIRHIDGLEPVKADIATRPYGSLDGDFFTGSIVGKRNIVITLGFNPDFVEHTVASLREKLYAYFMPKQVVILRIFRDDLPTVEIEGHVESCLPNIFVKDPEMVVSIICPLPDFISASASILTGMASDDPETVEFTVLGNVDTPILFEMAPEAGEPSYDGPIVLTHSTRLISELTTFGVTATLAPGISLLISSLRGNKVAQNIITATGEKTNLLQTMADGSFWPQLKPGTNKFSVVTDSATEKEWTLTYYEHFGGL